MTRTAANQNQHPYLRPEQFADRTFLRVRRQVAKLRLPYAEGRMRELLEEAIAIYDDLLSETKKPAGGRIQRAQSAGNEGGGSSPNCWRLGGGVAPTPRK